MSYLELPALWGSRALSLNCDVLLHTVSAFESRFSVLAPIDPDGFVSFDRHDYSSLKNLLGARGKALGKGKRM